MKKVISFLEVTVLLAMLNGCATMQPTTPRTYEGAGVGTVIGGIAGALLDSRNPWRGGVIGGALGLVAGATLTELSARAARKAVVYNRPVEYRTENGRDIYRAEPMGYNEQTRCSKIHERVWEEGRMVKDQIREVCEEPEMQASPIEQTLVREGFFAMKLAEALKIGPVKSEGEAESRLASMGIAPRNGWIADYPLTLNIIAELENAIGAAADSGKIAMKKDEAIKVFQNLIRDIKSQYAGVKPLPGVQPYPEPYYYPYPYPYPYYYPYPYAYRYYYPHHYYPFYRHWR